MKHLRSILFVFVALLLATAAHGQSTNVTASVPFDFVVADHSYPAGDYAVKSISDNGVPILIRNQDAAEKGVALSFPCSSVKPSSTTKLVFHRMGNQYFLYQVWTEGNTIGREFPMSKTEIQLARNSTPEIVIVAANLTR
jgi:hypothetical protein